MDSFLENNSRSSKRLNKENSFQPFSSTSSIRNKQPSTNKLLKNQSKQEQDPSSMQKTALHDLDQNTWSSLSQGECGMKSKGSGFISAHSKSSIDGGFLSILKAREIESTKKKDRIRQQTESDEMRECYFSPKINRNTEDIRPLTEFLSDQQKYETMKKKNKEQLVEQMQKDLTKDLTLVPRINSSTKRDKSVPIHERLYSLTRESLKTLESQQNYQQQSLSDRLFLTEASQNNNTILTTGSCARLFSPTINPKSKALARNKPIDVLLYSDAKRRQEKEKKPSEVISGSIQTNERSEMVFATSFIRMFEEAWMGLGKAHGKGDSSQTIDYLKMNRVLQQLLFITSQEIVSTEKRANPNLAKERSLVYDLWINLKGDKLNGVSKRNLLNFLIAVQGIKVPTTQAANSSLRSLDSKPLMTEESQQNTISTCPDDIKAKIQHRRDFGFFSNDTWTVGEDSVLLKQKYDFLLKTRLNQQRIRNLSPRIQREQQQLQSLRQTSNTHKLSSSFASLQNGDSSYKMVQIELKRQQSPLARVDLLVQQRTQQKLRHAEMKEANSEKDLEGCCFQPNLDRCSERLKSNPSIGFQKSITLHTNYQKPSSQRRDKQTVDLEYEKQCDECTFHPDISLTKSPVRKNENTSQDRFYEKTVSRMRQARQDSHNTSVWLQRGYNNTPCYQITSHNQSKKVDSFISSVNHFKSFDTEKQDQSMKLIANEMAQGPSNISTLEEEPDLSIGTRVNTVPSDRRNPLLFVDVNIDPEKSERIVIYEGDEAAALARDFSIRHNLDEKTTFKLEEMLLTQMSTLIDNFQMNDLMK